MQSIALPASTLYLLAALMTAHAQTLPSPPATQAQAAASDSAETEPVDTSIPSSSVSQVRIVRLSQVQGRVGLDRNSGRSFEVAFPNLPIVAGERLQTEEGLAEVEFEDNSSIRLAPRSTVEFPVLQRNSTGAASSTVKLLSGTLYASLPGGKASDELTLLVGNRRITLSPSSRLRIDVMSPTASLTVFNGVAKVGPSSLDPSVALFVTKKKTVTFDVTTEAAPVFAHNDPPAPYDEWDKRSAGYHSVRTSAAFTGASPYSYGVNDLSYYGNFSNVGGCGALWRPYLVDASWDPYGSGMWSWYPGQGFSWVSVYPWGWTPFHSGSWAYCPNGGWGWRADGNWNGIKNHPPLRPIQAPGKPRPLPPHPPRAGQPTQVAVNLKALPYSHAAGSGESFILSGNSAGLGIPRGAVSNLGKASRTAEQHGFTSVAFSGPQIVLGSNRSLTTAAYSSSQHASSSRSTVGTNTSGVNQSASSHPAPSSGFTAHTSSAPSYSAPSAPSVSSSSGAVPHGK